MNERLLLGGGAVLLGILLLGVVSGVAIIGPFGLLGGGSPPVTTTTTTTTTTPPTTSTETIESGTQTTAPGTVRNGTPTTTESGTTTKIPSTDGPSFAFVIDEIVECGTTCREVTATLTNNGTVTATDISVTVTLVVDDDSIWQGTESVGTLEPGESVTTIETVDVGIGGAAAIKANDGYVVIETVVDWDGGSRTFRTRQKVA